MTVAAVILSVSAEAALAPLDGTARVRRLAHAAWTSGAIPVVVVTPDPEEWVAAELAGSEATLVPPAPAEAGPVGQIVAGIEAAASLVAETSAALVWPARLAWVDASTLTALIEAHPGHADAVLRPSWEGRPGWPALVPTSRLDALRGIGTDRMYDLIDDLAGSGIPVVTLDLGDPGTVLDVGTPRDELPPFTGPSEPVSGHPPEWGASVAPGAE